MHMFYSGTTSTESLPEVVLKDINDGKGPAVMLTYYEIHSKCGDASKRMERHAAKTTPKRRKKRGAKSKS